KAFAGNSALFIRPALLQKARFPGRRLPHLLTAHNRFCFPDKLSGAEDAVRPGISDPYLMGITSLNHSPQTVAAPVKYFQNRIGDQDCKLCVPGSENKTFPEQPV